MWVGLSVSNQILYLLYMISKCQVPNDLYMSTGCFVEKLVANECV